MKKLFPFLILLAFCFRGFSATITGNLTNSYNQPETNFIICTPLLSFANADGSWSTRGLPGKIYVTNGFFSTNLNAGNYLLSNAVLTSQQFVGPGQFGTQYGVIIAVPSVNGVYPFGLLAIPGYNVYNYNGSAIFGNTNTSSVGQGTNVFIITNANSYTVEVPSQGFLTNGQTSIVYSNPAAYITPAQLGSSNYLTTITIPVSATNQFMTGTAVTNFVATTSTNDPSGAAVNVSNALWWAKQPASTTLTNLSATGANTNSPVGGAGMTLTTNSGVVTYTVNFNTNGLANTNYVNNATNGLVQSSALGNAAYGNTNTMTVSASTNAQFSVTATNVASGGTVPNYIVTNNYGTDLNLNRGLAVQHNTTLEPQTINDDALDLILSNSASTAYYLNAHDLANTKSFTINSNRVAGGDGLYLTNLDYGGFNLNTRQTITNNINSAVALVSTNDAAGTALGFFLSGSNLTVKDAISATNFTLSQVAAGSTNDASGTANGTFLSLSNRIIGVDELSVSNWIRFMQLSAGRDTNWLIGFGAGTSGANATNYWNGAGAWTNVLGGANFVTNISGTVLTYVSGLVAYSNGTGYVVGQTNFAFASGAAPGVQYFFPTNGLVAGAGISFSSSQGQTTISATGGTSAATNIVALAVGTITATNMLGNGAGLTNLSINQLGLPVSTLTNNWSMAGNTAVARGGVLGQFTTNVVGFVGGGQTEDAPLFFNIHRQPAMELGIFTGSGNTEVSFAPDFQLNPSDATLNNGQGIWPLMPNYIGSVTPFTLSPWGASILGGQSNVIYNTSAAGTPSDGSAAVGYSDSSILGGFGNSITNAALSVAGGFYGTVSSGHNGTFVWSDFSTNGRFSSTSSNQFLIRSAGGMGLNTNNPAGYAFNVAGGINAYNLYINGISLGNPFTTNTGANVSNIVQNIAAAAIQTATNAVQTIITNTQVAISNSIAGNAALITNAIDSLAVLQQGGVTNQYLGSNLIVKMATNYLVVVITNPAAATGAQYAYSPPPVNIFTNYLNGYWITNNLNSGNFVLNNSAGAAQFTKVASGGITGSGWTPVAGQGAVVISYGTVQDFQNGGVNPTNFPASALVGTVPFGTESPNSLSVWPTNAFYINPNGNDTSPIGGTVYKTIQAALLAHSANSVFYISGSNSLPSSVGLASNIVFVGQTPNTLICASNINTFPSFIFTNSNFYFRNLIFSNVIFATVANAGAVTNLDLEDIYFANFNAFDVLHPTSKGWYNCNFKNVKAETQADCFDSIFNSRLEECDLVVNGISSTINYCAAFAGDKNILKNTRLVVTNELVANQGNPPYCLFSINLVGNEVDNCVFVGNGTNYTIQATDEADDGYVNWGSGYIFSTNAVDYHPNAVFTVAKLNGNGGGLTNVPANGLILTSTNYVAANFIPPGAGQVKFCVSNNWMFTVTQYSTNAAFKIGP